MPVLILFRSLTYAQRGARALERGGIRVHITKAPQGTTERGCTYCLRIPESQLYRALHILNGVPIEHGRILREGKDGVYREVQP